MKRCGVEGCVNAYHSRGFCKLHYIRNWRYGNPLQGDFAHDFNGRVEVTDGCWNWTGAFFNSGYGKVVRSGRTLRAHRVAYELSVGPIGDLHVLHKCDNPACVRPDHLWLGTHQDNMNDMKQKRRYNVVPALTKRGVL